MNLAQRALLLVTLCMAGLNYFVIETQIYLCHVYDTCEDQVQPMLQPTPQWSEERKGGPHPLNQAPPLVYREKITSSMQRS